MWMDEGKKSLSWMSFFHGSSPLPVDDKKILANLFFGLLVDDRKFAFPRILSSTLSLDDGKKSLPRSFFLHPFFPLERQRDLKLKPNLKLIFLFFKNYL
jgi:hypothetical protein